MNPPTSPTPQVHRRDQAVEGPAHVEPPAYLTLDEMRELPMHLALGFDVEGEDR